MEWSSNKSGGTSVQFQGDGNLVVYDGPVPPDSSSSPLWNSATCDSCPISGQGVILHFPGPTSMCPCKDYMCMVVEVTFGGPRAYYYAEIDGAEFTDSPTC